MIVHVCRVAELENRLSSLKQYSSKLENEAKFIRRDEEHGATLENDSKKQLQLESIGIYKT